MNKNEELLYLRQEITRLKIRLTQLDPTEEPTCVTCGHDVALENLKKLCKQHGLSGLSQLVGIENKWGWYTTNINPERIEYYLRDQDTVSKLYSIIATPKIWKALTDLFHERDAEIDEETKSKLLVYNLIDRNCKLTTNGVFCYIVAGHLCFNLTLKQDVGVALKIFEQLFEITNKQYGENLGITYTEMISLLKKHDKYELLRNQGITDNDLQKYYYQECC